MRVKARAKLNLILNVLGEREDGYHEIETVYYAIDLCDNVSIEEVVDDDDYLIMFDRDGEAVELDRENLAARALDEMRLAFGKKSSYDIRIEKRIPIAAGLGGGSADAAAIIYMLATMWKIEDTDKLFEICLKLGSDVPFCFATQCGHNAAIGTGRGEKLKYISLPKLQFELREGDLSIPDKTAAVYAELRDSDCEHRYDINALLCAEDLDAIENSFGNQLQAPLERLTGIQVKDYVLCGAGPMYFRLLR